METTISQPGCILGNETGFAMLKVILLHSGGNEGFYALILRKYYFINSYLSLVKGKHV